MSDKACVTHSGGMDSLAIMLEYVEKLGPKNVISLGFQYGQRHFEKENEAATRFCKKHGIERIILDVPIGQIGGCSLIDHSIPVTENMEDQRSTVVPNRNMIFMALAASVAQVRGCNIITHGACQPDFAAYRDCRAPFFALLQGAIQAGLTQPIKGSENISDDIWSDNTNDKIVGIPNDKYDIRIETPLIFETKRETLKRIVEKFGLDVYKDSYSCYNGGEIQCGRCPACIERRDAFEFNGLIDPIEYYKD